MNKARVQRLIPKAMEYIQKHFVTNGAVPKVYQGYLASFGPSVISSGLSMAIAFNSDTDKTDKNRMMDMFLYLIKTEMPDIKASTLLEFINQDSNYKDYFVKHLILDANIASKLAIRTFTLKDM
jgi:CRISPR-associated protein Cmr5